MELKELWPRCQCSEAEKGGQEDEWICGGWGQGDIMWRTNSKDPTQPATVSISVAGRAQFQVRGLWRGWADQTRAATASWDGTLEEQPGPSSEQIRYNTELVSVLAHGHL